MKTLAGFTLLAAWLSAALDVTQARAETVYFALGGELVLRPQLSVPITSITWKNKGNIVAEWIERVLPLEYYGGFKTNTVLNVITGELIISNMTKDHDGSFTVEVNFKYHDVVYDTVGIKKVSQPQVILRPLTCNKETSKVCTLSCEAEVSGAEPVTYLWKKGGGKWTEAEKDLSITNDEETQGVETFSCRLKNPVSEADSEPFPNAFFPLVGP
ncbi:SLAM family member 9-like [Leuresthes tenuis]|uniref:SLAM family member 9-like n=1 Tax=Leuresthes tenuis TaxID=355514 RepID=UPI003B5011AE